MILNSKINLHVCKVEKFLQVRLLEQNRELEGCPGRARRVRLTLTFPNETFKWHIYSLRITIVPNHFEIHPHIDSEWLVNRTSTENYFMHVRVYVHAVFLLQHWHMTSTNEPLSIE